jgi:sugar (pentulose or hexulose) kinase
MNSSLTNSENKVLLGYYISETIILKVVVLDEGYIIAIDLGASGSKMAAARLSGGGVKLEDIYTFPNVPLRLGPGLYWDIFDLYKHILQGLAWFGSKYGKPRSIGIDTWGATYGFLDARGRLAEPVFHYRDKRTAGVLEKLYAGLSRREIFALTGCQCASSYTLVQLYASVLQDDVMLSGAKHLVLLPDLLAYFLGGALSTERTIAGTTAMMEPSQRDWCRPLLDTLHIPSGFLLPLSDTGAIKGTLSASVAEETGMGAVPIVSAIGHDSAAAVAAIPSFDEDSLYISIGTNISMGIYRTSPALEDGFYEGGFKNTGGDGGKIIVYRDFPAAWMLNRLYVEWVKTDTALSFDNLDTLAAHAEQGALFDIEDPLIQEGEGSMSRTIAGLIGKTGQPVPDSRDTFTVSVMESIALRVRYYADKLVRLRGKDFDKIWLISGGTRYKTLVSLIADALGRPVYAGLPYATLLGNAVSQACAMEALDRNHYRDTGDAGTSRFTEIRPGAMRRPRNWPECTEWAVEKGIL